MRVETLIGLVLGGAVLVGLWVATLPWTVQPMLRALLFLRYRIVVRGLENLPRTGPALLAANHVSWYDGFFLAATCPRRGRALVNAGIISKPVLRHIARRAGLIPVPFSGPRAQRALIQACRDALDRGEVVGIFPEGQISRNGLTGPFHRGLEVIVSGRDQVPVIPVSLDNLWGSMLSYSGGRFFKKRPRGFRRTVYVVYGPPVAPPITAFAVRQGVLEASVHARSLHRAPPPRLETIDLALPHLELPGLGLLTGSTADVVDGAVRQTGHKPGTVGQALPGVALRIVDEAGTPRPPDGEGQVQALVAGQTGWVATGLRGSLDRDGFLRIALERANGPSVSEQYDLGSPIRALSNDSDDPGTE